MAVFKLKGDYNTGKVWLNGKELDLKKSLKVKYHSPTGFSWGYKGQGTKQLSIAIGLTIYDRKLALETYLDINERIVSKLPYQKSFEQTISYYP